MYTVSQKHIRKNIFFSMDALGNYTGHIDTPKTPEKTIDPNDILGRKAQVLEKFQSTLKWRLSSLGIPFNTELFGKKMEDLVNKVLSSEKIPDIAKRKFLDDLESKMEIFTKISRDDIQKLRDHRVSTLRIVWMSELEELQFMRKDRNGNLVKMDEMDIQIQYLRMILDANLAKYVEWSALGLQAAFVDKSIWLTEWVYNEPAYKKYTNDVWAVDEKYGLNLGKNITMKIEEVMKWKQEAISWNSDIALQWLIKTELLRQYALLHPEFWKRYERIISKVSQDSTYPVDLSMMRDKVDGKVISMKEIYESYLWIYRTWSTKEKEIRSAKETALSDSAISKSKKWLGFDQLESDFSALSQEKIEDQLRKSSSADIVIQILQAAQIAPALGDVLGVKMDTGSALYGIDTDGKKLTGTERTIAWVMWPLGLIFVGGAINRVRKWPKAIMLFAALKKVLTPEKIAEMSQKLWDKGKAFIEMIQKFMMWIGGGINDKINSAQARVWLQLAAVSSDSSLLRANNNANPKLTTNKKNWDTVSGTMREPHPNLARWGETASEVVSSTMGIQERKERLLMLPRNTPEQREYFRIEVKKLRETIDQARITVVQIIQEIEKGLKECDQKGKKMDALPQTSSFVNVIKLINVLPKDIWDIAFDRYMDFLTHLEKQAQINLDVTTLSHEFFDWYTPLKHFTAEVTPFSVNFMLDVDDFLGIAWQNPYLADKSFEGFHRNGAIFEKTDSSKIVRDHETQHARYHHIQKGTTADWRGINDREREAIMQSSEPSKVLDNVQSIFWDRLRHLAEVSLKDEVIAFYKWEPDLDGRNFAYESLIQTGENANYDYSRELRKDIMDLFHDNPTLQTEVERVINRWLERYLDVVTKMLDTIYSDGNRTQEELDLMTITPISEWYKFWGNVRLWNPLYNQWLRTNITPDNTSTITGYIDKWNEFNFLEISWNDDNWKRILLVQAENYYNWLREENIKHAAKTNPDLFWELLIQRFILREIHGALKTHPQEWFQKLETFLKSPRQFMEERFRWYGMSYEWEKRQFIENGYSYDYPEEYKMWNASQSLAAWYPKENLPQVVKAEIPDLEYAVRYGNTLWSVVERMDSVRNFDELQAIWQEYYQISKDVFRELIQWIFDGKHWPDIFPYAMRSTLIKLLRELTIDIAKWTKTDVVIKSSTWLVGWAILAISSHALAIDGNPNIPKEYSLASQLQLWLNEDAIKTDAYLKFLWPDWVRESNMEQWDIGNCYLIAAIQSIKQHPNCIKILKNIIKPWKNEWEWIVKFQKPKTEIIVNRDQIDWVRKMRATWSLGDNILEIAYWQLIAQKNKNNQSIKWSDLFENNGKPVSAGGLQIEVLEALFGENLVFNERYNASQVWELKDVIKNVDFKNAYTHHPIDLLWRIKEFIPDISEEEIQKMKDDYENWKSLDIYSFKVMDYWWNVKNIVFNHAYTIWEINPDGYVEVINPHDTENDRIILKIEDFKKFFEWISLSKLI